MQLREILSAAEMFSLLLCRPNRPIEALALRVLSISRRDTRLAFSRSSAGEGEKETSSVRDVAAIMKDPEGFRSLGRKQIASSGLRVASYHLVFLSDEIRETLQTRARATAADQQGGSLRGA